MTRKIVVPALLAATMLGFAAPAMADTAPSGGGVVVVDQPDTSNLNNIWTFAPLGVPVFGAIQAVLQAPARLLG
ncbi:hypothetical protein GCM10010174_17080 [Kutzneria viridogrisea]|uniref:Parvulin-like peptidyl-prolyl isomerase n=1 Tax=Kutzneria viridogrisea TaxID=47990 RepID=A0ABR6BDE2_9PSEU|nr:parvulin-like peptidyl-prolyl isomerase [Kutzneria viridogrisea]